MDNAYREAFAEVLEVLKNSNQNIVEKIPEKFIAFLNENKNNNYIVNIDFTDANWENSIRQEAQVILALIYRDYIVSPEEREKLLIEEKEEQIKIEKELREKYNPDDIFKRNATTVQQDLETNTQLIDIENYPWYKKLYYRILKILGIKH